MNRRYRIGEFARLGGTSVKTLRFYEQQGLLRPCDVDSRNGYRYYGADQLHQLAAIRALKELGATLADIRRVIVRGSADGARRELLARLRANALRTLASTSRSLEWIELELENVQLAVPRASVILKSGREVRIASIRATLRSYDDIVGVERELMESLRPEMTGEMRGVLWHRCEASGAIEGEPFVEMRSRGSGHRVQSLPDGQLATAYCEPDDAAAVRTYDDIDRWIHRHSLKLSGPKREIYLGPLLEIQFPVRPA